MQSGGQQAVPGAGGMLELDGLRRRYGDVAALDGLSFTVPPGRVFGFLGPNGAGKTTAMRAIVGVAAMDGGVASRSARRSAGRSATCRKSGACIRR